MKVKRIEVKRGATVRLESEQKVSPVTGRPMWTPAEFTKVEYSAEAELDADDEPEEALEALTNAVEEVLRRKVDDIEGVKRPKSRASRFTGAL